MEGHDPHASARDHRASTSATAFFDAIAGRYSRAYALDSNESRRRMARALGLLPSPPADVLDLGVGPGREIPFLLDQGYAPVGLDSSKAMLEHCARRARPIPLVQADFWQPLPFEDRSFDGVLALHGTLAHSSDAGALERLSFELARVTRPGAVWLSEVPSPAWLDSFDIDFGSSDCVIRRTGTQACEYEDRIASASIHVRIPSADDWRGALAPLWTVEIENIEPQLGAAHGIELAEAIRPAIEWRLIARRR